MKESFREGVHQDLPALRASPRPPAAQTLVAMRLDDDFGLGRCRAATIWFWSMSDVQIRVFATKNGLLGLALELFDVAFELEALLFCFQCFERSLVFGLARVDNGGGARPDSANAFCSNGRRRRRETGEAAERGAQFGSIER